MTRFKEDCAVNLGFQIAPMIDVVFVIMLFFMAMASVVKVEKVINSKLPGVIYEKEISAGPPEEAIISIEEDGTIALNEDEMDQPLDERCAHLTAALMRLKESIDAQKGKLLVTVVSHQQVPYHRVMDVLNALTKAGIPNVTFTIGDSEN